MSIIKYIRKSVKSIVRWAVNDYESKNYADDTSIPIAGGSHSKASTGTSGIGTNGMNFIVYPATGGKVIEFRSYDPRTDRMNNNLYVVTDKENLGEELGQIITKESLCR